MDVPPFLDESCTLDDEHDKNRYVRIIVKDDRDMP